LTVSVTGSGSITSTPAGINCPNECTQAYNQGVGVSLTATPENGWEFSEWVGACDGAGSCTVVMSDDASVSAIFTKVRPNSPGNGVPLTGILPLLLDD
ncbi:MAG: hypothetical protein KAG66_08705, partial [Methylococcales bacterium]|nr:hypothetical protein [Methylococcales bacterium]